MRKSFRTSEHIAPSERAAHSGRTAILLLAVSHGPGRHPAYPSKRWIERRPQRGPDQLSHSPLSGRARPAGLPRRASHLEHPPLELHLVHQHDRLSSNRVHALVLQPEPSRGARSLPAVQTTRSHEQGLGLTARESDEVAVESEQVSVSVLGAAVGRSWARGMGKEAEAASLDPGGSHQSSRSDE